MKALSVCQPYAHLIATGEKLVENRTWATSYRGWLAIHASKSRKFLVGHRLEERLSFGAFVAFAWLEQCLRFEEIPGHVKRNLSASWLLYHRHAEGPVCWVFTCTFWLPKPIPFRGRQRLFDVPREVANKGIDQAILARLFPGTDQQPLLLLV